MIEEYAEYPDGQIGELTVPPQAGGRAPILGMVMARGGFRR